MKKEVMVANQQEERGDGGKPARRERRWCQTSMKREVMVTNQQEERGDGDKPA